MQVYTKPVNCTSVHKTSLLYKSTHNQFSVQVYTKPAHCTSVHKPVHCTSVHKTSSLYKCTQNQYTVQIYTKPAHCTSLHKTSLLVNNERNVHGQNITKVRLYELCAKCVQTVTVHLLYTYHTFTVH